MAKVFYGSVLTEVLEVVARELSSIVGDNLLGKSEACDHIRLQELPDLEVGYSAECFCLNPLGELIGYY